MRNTADIIAIIDLLVAGGTREQARNEIADRLKTCGQSERAAAENADRWMVYFDRNVPRRSTPTGTRRSEDQQE